MNELRKFYIKWTGSAALCLALLAYLIPTHFLPSLQQPPGSHHWLVAIVSTVTQRWALLVILLLVELFIRKCLWRILRPELDFSGKWKGFTQYTHVRIGTAPVPFGFAQEVRIKQDCLSIRLEPSEGGDFTFKSLAIDILEREPKLVYAYHVRYGATAPNRPIEAYGYEELEVVGERKWYRPQRLKGWFSHCARGQVPVYSGEVELFRSDS